MHLSTEQILEFQKLYKEQFGKDISTEEAQDQGLKLVHLIQLIYEPMTKEQYLSTRKEIQNIQARINERK